MFWTIVTRALDVLFLAVIGLFVLAAIGGWVITKTWGDWE